MPDLLHVLNCKYTQTQVAALEKKVLYRSLEQKICLWRCEWNERVWSNEKV